MERLLYHSVQNLSMVTSKDGIEVYSGHIDGEENYSKFVNNLNALGISFYTRRSRKCKSSTLFMSDRKDSDINIPFMGSPFKILKTMYMMCCQDANYNPRTSNAVENHLMKKRRRVSSNPTKKLGCPAYMIVKSIVIFEDEAYKINASYKSRSIVKLKVLEKLNKDLRSSRPPVGTLRYILLISPEEDHIHSPETVNLNQTLHPQLQREIYKLAGENICSIPEVRLHLEVMVSNMFSSPNSPQPDLSNRAFYPSDKIIQYHIHQALLKINKAQFARELIEEDLSLSEGEITDFTERGYHKTSENILVENKGHHQLQIEDQTIVTDENVNIKDVWNESRRSLINMIGLTYLDHGAENTLELAQSIKELEENMKISAKKNRKKLDKAKSSLINQEVECLDSNKFIDELHRMKSENFHSDEESDSADYFIINVTEENS